jgi:hypothetical protein
MEPTKIEFAEPATDASGKKLAPIFAAVRSRGMINASMDALAKNFEDHYREQNLGTRWEFYNPNITGGTDLVMFREGMGYKIVTWDMMPNQTETTQKGGMVKRGDLILLCAPWEIIREEMRQDAANAQADVKAPEAAYKDSLENRKVKRSDNETDQAVGVGQIKVRQEEVAPPRTTDA